MFENLWYSFQRKLTSLALLRLSKKVIGEEIDVKEIWNKIGSIVVIWPGEGLDMLAARVVLNRVRERFANASLTLVALPGVGASAPSEIEAELISLRREDISIFGIPKKAFAINFSAKSFDLVIDLSPVFDPLAAYLCLSTRAPLRIGFACEEADKIYNYQVSPRSDRSGIDKYRVLARYIG